MDKRTKITKVLRKYLPEGTEDYVVDLFYRFPVSFKVVRPRKTKLGDFRGNLRDERPQITVNGNLNQYAFLVTTVHEFAHLKTWNEYRHKAKAHGEEWKQNFIELMHPLVQMGILPRDVEQALLNSFTNMKASSCTDVQLQRVLKKYDVFETNEILLEKLPNLTIFVLGKQVFQKGELRRTRFLCTEVSTGKQYLINKLATVELVENEQQ